MPEDPSATAPAAHPLEKLSPREAEVALMLGVGITNHEIAKALGLSVKTIDTHRLHILKKLDLGSNVKLALYMVRHGLVQP